MEKQSRFYFLTFLSVRLLVSFFILGFTRDMMDRYLVNYAQYTEVIFLFISIARTLVTITLLGIVAYYIYISYRYLTSRFYQVSKIPIHEAFYHGYMDLSYVYERLYLVVDEISYDTKLRSISITKGTKDYHILVRDYFGKIQGETKSDTWYIVSKKKKEYGRIRYMKKKPFPNPIYENKKYINSLQSVTNKEYENLVCITGLQRNTFQDDCINTIYEIESLIYKGNQLEKALN